MQCVSACASLRIHARVRVFPSVFQRPAIGCDRESAACEGSDKGLMVRFSRKCKLKLVHVPLASKIPPSPPPPPPPALCPVAIFLLPVLAGVFHVLVILARLQLSGVLLLLPPLFVPSLASEVLKVLFRNSLFNHK